MKTGRAAGSGADAGEPGNTGGEDGESAKQQTAVVVAASQMLPRHSTGCASAQCGKDIQQAQVHYHSI